MSTDPSALLFTTNNEFTADMVAAFLRDNGIPVLKKYQGLGLHFKLIMGTPTNVHPIDLFVPRAALTQAQELLDALMNADEILEDDEWPEDETEHL